MKLLPTGYPDKSRDPICLIDKCWHHGECEDTNVLVVHVCVFSSHWSPLIPRRSTRLCALCSCATVLARRSVYGNLLAVSGNCTAAASPPDVSVIRDVKLMPAYHKPTTQGHNVSFVNPFMPKYQLANTAVVIIRRAEIPHLVVLL